MAKEISAGLIVYYFDNETKQFKFLLAHPGGPYFKNVKKFGFPKGRVEEGEVQMLGRKYFSQKQVQNLKTYEVANKLDEIGHKWDDEVRTVNKYGNLFIREAYLGEGYNPKTKETVEVTRHDWFGTPEEQMKEFLSVRELEDLQKTKIFERLDFKE